MKKGIERQLPNNPDAEEALLGSMIIDPYAILNVIEYLRVIDFYRNEHRLIYETILSLHQKQTPADLITLNDELERRDLLEKVGGTGFLSSLANRVPTSGNITYYADIVCKLSQFRQLIYVAGQIAASAYEEEDQALEKAETLVGSIHRGAAQGTFTGMSELMNSYLEELDFLHEHKGSLTGVTTGYEDLDIVLGGLQKSDLILLAARPSMGKTALSLCMAYHAAKDGKRVVIFSLEMGKKSLARRLVSMVSKVDMQRLRTGWIEDGEWDRIIDSGQILSSLPIWINDTAGNPVLSMRSQLRRFVQDYGDVDLIVIDYLGLIDPDDKENDRRDNQVQQISKISKGLKKLARDFDVPVLALCQLSRAVENRALKVPMLSDLRDSGSLEQDADVVLFIYRDDYYAKIEQRESESPNMADVYIAKQRNGPTGNVSLFFRADQTMFYNLEEVPNEQR